jgi:hypothetical protein
LVLQIELSLEYYLWVYSTYWQDNWSLKLALAEFIYNNSTHSTTGVSPFRAIYSYNPEICVNVEDDVIEGRSVATYKRAKVIAGKREELDRY